MKPLQKISSMLSSKTAVFVSLVAISAFFVPVIFSWVQGNNQSQGASKKNEYIGQSQNPNHRLFPENKLRRHIIGHHRTNQKQLRIGSGNTGANHAQQKKSTRLGFYQILRRMNQNLIRAAILAQIGK